MTTVVVRLSLDELRSARARRERYVGPWLPEPLLVDEADPAAASELADALSMAFLVLLETLSPLERAAFLLHEVFGYDYGEIAAMLDKQPAACRQLVEPGLLVVDDGAAYLTMSFDILDDRIVGIRVVSNPEKLSGIAVRGG